MADDGLLRQRVAERDHLLASIVTILYADDRVIAAWLAGSLGRGTADAWSDLDLWVVVEDAAVAAVSAERQAFVASVGSTPADT